MLVNAGIQLLAGEVESLYRLLTADDIGAAEQTCARRRLEREGIDVQSLLSNFVSYQSVRTYLTNHAALSMRPIRIPPRGRRRPSAASGTGSCP